MEASKHSNNECNPNPFVSTLQRFAPKLTNNNNNNKMMMISEFHTSISSTVDECLRFLHSLASQNPLLEKISQFHHQLRTTQIQCRNLKNMNTLSTHNFAAVLPGDSVAGLVVANGLSNFLNLYNTLLVVRLVLTWFPSAPPAIVSPLSTICDPYLNIFRGLIPPLGGTLDLSPILAFLVLNAFTSTASALPAELPQPGESHRQLRSSPSIFTNLTSSQKKWMRRFRGIFLVYIMHVMLTDRTFHELVEFVSCVSSKSNSHQIPNIIDESNKAYPIQPHAFPTHQPIDLIKKLERPTFPLASFWKDSPRKIASKRLSILPIASYRGGRYSSFERLAAIGMIILAVVSPLFIDHRPVSDPELDSQPINFASWLPLLLVLLILGIIISLYLDRSFIRFDPYMIHRVGGSSGGIVAILFVLAFIVKCKASLMN
ncbi:hypothetical protein ACFE04_019225 [Oxalis oulophora]